MAGHTPNKPGQLTMNFVSVDGISGKGSLFLVKFHFIPMGINGKSSPVQISQGLAWDAETEVDLLVEVATPSATEITKLENKALVSYIYIGKPMGGLKKTLGEEPRIQLNDAFAIKEDIIQWVEMEKNRRNEAEVTRITWSMKVDSDTKMGIVTDVKQELRKANALKINYSTMETDKIVD